MLKITNKFRAFPKFFLFLAFFSGFLYCYASESEYYFTDYLDRIDNIVKYRNQLPKSIYKKQRDVLINNEKNIHALDFSVKNSKQKYTDRRAYFDRGGREKLIAEWEAKLGINWPTYICNKCCRKNNRCNHSRLEAHHVIPLGYNGANKWWNIFPLTIDEHTGVNGIHSSAEAQAWFPKVKK